MPPAGHRPPSMARKQVDGPCGITRLNLVTAKAEVRSASDADLATLVAVLGERHRFTDRLEQARTAALVNRERTQRGPVVLKLNESAGR
jgi:hypothetical protein